MNEDDPLATHCPKCGFVGRALSICEICGEFISVTLALGEEASPSAALDESPNKE